MDLHTLSANTTRGRIQGDHHTSCRSVDRGVVEWNNGFICKKRCAEFVILVIRFELNKIRETVYKSWQARMEWNAQCGPNWWSIMFSVKTITIYFKLLIILVQ